ncbi:hypothetical protein H9P43_003874 [Blastocladiella emersonii ATCC 22665]|nr:hypothetical protein H9P43_003874 [Blastocladiella emersonii ATCC 22665]
MAKAGKKKSAAPGAAVVDLVDIDALTAVAAALQQSGTASSPAAKSAAEDGAQAITSALHAAYNASQLYTNLGATALVAVAPPPMSTVLAELSAPAVQDKYYKRYKNLKADLLPSQVAAGKVARGDSLPPHIYALANTLYFSLRRSGVDQSVVFRGDPGSGKSVQAQLLLDQLCTLSGNSKRDERMHARIRAAQTVLRTFGSAKTAGGPDSTRFGGYYEVQFSDRGKLVGLKTLAYAVERDRVVAQRMGERNFHAFYALLAAATTEMRQAFGLLPSSVFPYLNYGATLATGPGGMDDATRFAAVAEAMKTVGIGKRSQHYVWKLLAAILHLGNIQFEDDQFHHQDSCAVRNRDALGFVADLLEVDSRFLESTLTSRTTLVGRDLVTQLLTSSAAATHRDNLAGVLYHVLFAWLVEQCNRKLCVDDEAECASFISIVDFPSAASVPNQSRDALGHALASEKLDEVVFRRLAEYGDEELRQEGLRVPATPLAPTATAAASAYAAAVRSDDAAAEALPGDFINLIRGGNGQAGSRAALFHDMFSEHILNMDAYERNAATVLRARTLMRRTPSMKRRPAVVANSASNDTLVESGSSRRGLSELAVLGKHLDGLVLALESTQVKPVFCLAPNHDGASTAFDTKSVRAQAARMQLPALAAHIRARGGDFTVRFDHAAFAAKYAPLLADGATAAGAVTARDQCARVKAARGLADDEMHVGPRLVVLRDDAWAFLETALRKIEQEAKKRTRSGGPVPAAHDRPLFNPNGGADARTEYSFENDSVYSDGMTDDGMATDMDIDADSVYAESIALTAMPRGFKNGGAKSNDPLLKGGSGGASAAGGSGGDGDGQVIEEEPVSGARRRWVALTWCLTWWVPTFCLRRCGKMEREDVRMAWREKTAICILIAMVCAIQLFFIIGFGRVVCPRQNVLNLNELFYKKSADEQYVGIYGAVYDLKDFYDKTYHTPELLGRYAGLDITAGFPRTPSYYCQYAAQNAPDFPPLFSLQAPANGSYVRVRHQEFYDTDLWASQRRIDWKLRQRIVGLVGWEPGVVLDLSTKNAKANRLMFILGTRVYDLQPYVNAAGQGGGFLPSDIVEFLKEFRGQDLTSNKQFRKAWDSNRPLRDCFNNLFVVGTVDYRKSARCQITNYVLLGFSVLLAAVIGGKFLAAIQLNGAGVPEEHDKFVILQVPCYTEGEDSLRQCIDSLATLRYDDKRKLLFLICDGNVMGSGNDRPTPRIVLDILGVDPSVDPEPLSFQSLGDGMKQHNMGKVYTGLYECQGHLVPYIVVVKVGKPSETAKPGNRGKRDSQMIMMRFLNKVMKDAPMSPLELEMYHQIKNVIGVNPAFYEYCLMVDADTVVMPDSLTRLVSVMMHDTKIMACCGETNLSNEKETWATMIQVYEYWISHHLAKAFESLFGSVTCLPGCFSMYRLRSPNKSLPILVSDDIIRDYGETKVDTLHMKNLLHLGEDRYLTTLMLKHHTNLKTVFTPDAKCNTIAPDSWDVLLSQRRRWINSTIHNLFELLNIRQLCGVCCFSMRFIVLIDVLGTLMQPAIVAYLGYLAYMIVESYRTNDSSSFPILSLILLAVTYGFQVIIFFLKREWQMIGWMLIYIIAIPVFSGMIPIYSFWRQDDASWGSTRIVVGADGKKIAVAADSAEKFDISMIPHRRWSEYESEVLHEGAARHPMEGSQYGSGDDLYFDSRSAGSAAGGAGGVFRRSTVQSSATFGGMSAATFGNAAAGAEDLKRNNTTRTTGMDSILQLYLPQTPPPAAVGSGAAATGFPTDAEIYAEVQRILATANLMTVTKKQVRDEVSALFNVDLTPRKDFINQCIADVLSSGQQ